jgi:hypothetical protein
MTDLIFIKIYYLKIKILNLYTKEIKVMFSIQGLIIIFILGYGSGRVITLIQEDIKRNKANKEVDDYYRSLGVWKEGTN